MRYRSRKTSATTAATNVETRSDASESEGQGSSKSVIEKDESVDTVTGDTSDEDDDDELRYQIGQIVTKTDGRMYYETTSGCYLITYGRIDFETEIVDKLWQHGELGIYNPRAMLLALWFYITRYFGIGSRTDHANLWWGNLALEKDNDGVEKIVFVHQRNGLNPKLQAMKPLYAVRGVDKTRCPVALFREFTKRRPLNTCAHNYPFYLQPDKDYNSHINQPWFNPCGLGKNKIGGMLNGALKRIGLPTMRHVSLNRFFTNGFPLQAALESHKKSKGKGTPAKSSNDIIVSTDKPLKTISESLKLRITNLSGVPSIVPGGGLGNEITVTNSPFTRSQKANMLSPNSIQNPATTAAVGASGADKLNFRKILPKLRPKDPVISVVSSTAPKATTVLSVKPTWTVPTTAVTTNLNTHLIQLAKAESMLAAVKPTITLTTSPTVAAVVNRKREAELLALAESAGIIDSSAPPVKVSRMETNSSDSGNQESVHELLTTVSVASSTLNSALAATASQLEELPLPGAPSYRILTSLLQEPNKNKTSDDDKSSQEKSPVLPGDDLEINNGMAEDTASPRTLSPPQLSAAHDTSIVTAINTIPVEESEAEIDLTADDEETPSTSPLHIALPQAGNEGDSTDDPNASEPVIPPPMLRPAPSLQLRDEDDEEDDDDEDDSDDVDDVDDDDLDAFQGDKSSDPLSPNGTDNFDFANLKIELRKSDSSPSRSVKLELKEIQELVAASIGEERMVTADSQFFTDILWKTRALSDRGPWILIFSMWWMIQLHFGIGSRMNHVKLKWGHFRLVQDKTESRIETSGVIIPAEMNEYLEYVGPKEYISSKNTYITRRLGHPKDGSSKDFLSLYKIYKNRRLLSCLSGDSPFYLQPLNGNAIRKQLVWFGESPLGKNRIGALLRNIVEKVVKPNLNRVTHLADGSRRPSAPVSMVPLTGDSINNSITSTVDVIQRHLQAVVSGELSDDSNQQNDLLQSEENNCASNDLSSVQLPVICKQTEEPAKPLSEKQIRRIHAISNQNGNPAKYSGGDRIPMSSELYTLSRYIDACVSFQGKEFPSYIEKLWAGNVLGTHSPWSINFTTWFINTLVFGVESRNEHLRLKWGDFALKKTLDGVEYLQFYNRTTAEHYCLVSSGDNERDPIHVYKFYKEHRPPSTCESYYRFYLQPRIVVHKFRNMPWFTEQGWGKNKLGGLMSEAANMVGLPLYWLRKRRARQAFPGAKNWTLSRKGEERSSDSSVIPTVTVSSSTASSTANSVISPPLITSGTRLTLLPLLSAKSPNINQPQVSNRLSHELPALLTSSPQTNNPAVFWLCPAGSASSGSGGPQFTVVPLAQTVHAQQQQQLQQQRLQQLQREQQDLQPQVQSVMSMATAASTDEELVVSAAGTDDAARLSDSGAEDLDTSGECVLLSVDEVDGVAGAEAESNGSETDELPEPKEDDGTYTITLEEMEEAQEDICRNAASENSVSEDKDDFLKLPTVSEENDISVSPLADSNGLLSNHGKRRRKNYTPLKVLS